MIEKYRSEVLRSYEQKKASGELSANLVHYTPCNIRNETRLIFGTGCDPMDLRTLREFFDLSFDKEVSDLSIKKCDPDKFKPLCNYLKKGIKTKERNIELLAWLIDFHPRPFSNYWRTANGKSDLSLLTISQVGVVEEHGRRSPNGTRSNPQIKQQHYTVQNNQAFKLENWTRNETELIEQPECFENPAQEVTLEYPSGVKLKVAANDISLIARLVRL